MSGTGHSAGHSTGHGTTPAARMGRGAGAAGAAGPARPLGEALDDLLGGFVGAYEDLLAALAEHKVAIAKADGPAIVDASERERAALLRIEALEAERRALLGLRPASARGPGAADSVGEPTLSALAKSQDEPRRSRLVAQAERLRELMRETVARQRVVRLASESVMTHMRGVMGQVAARLSHAGTYGRLGRVDAGHVHMSAVDVRS